MKSKKLFIVFFFDNSAFIDLSKPKTTFDVKSVMHFMTDYGTVASKVGKSEHKKGGKQHS